MEGALFGGAIALAIGLVVAAVILRGGIALHNKMVKGAPPPVGVAMPAFGRALGIAAVNLLATGLAGFLIGLLVGLIAGFTGSSSRSAAQLAQWISFPIGVLVMGAVLKAMLPTDFMRAMKVVLCVLLIYLVIAAGVALVVIGFSLAAS